MTLITPKRIGNTCFLQASGNGFTLLEMVVVVAIVAATTTWAIPQFTRGIEQSKVDSYTQNLQTGLFNLKNRVQKSSKQCTLFKNLPANTTEDFDKLNYISPDGVLELFNISKKIENANLNDYLDCPLDLTDDRQSKTRFRFLQREGSSEKDNVEILYFQKGLTSGDEQKYERLPSQYKYLLNNLGTNDEGNDMIFRIRSKKYDQDSRLRTRCIVFTGNGHMSDGTWSYTSSECYANCPENHNCNRDDSAA